MDFLVARPTIRMPQKNAEEIVDNVMTVLAAEHVPGFRAFRPEQRRALVDVVRGKTVFANLATSAMPFCRILIGSSADRCRCL